jgi:hypothetical protein
VATLAAEGAKKSRSWRVVIGYDENDKLLRITKNLASESSNINPRPITFPGNGARNSY